MDNKISFLAGYILTAATTISAAGVLNAILLGALGGFFGIIGKEAYYYIRDEYKAKSPIAKAWIAKKIEWVKSKL
jgi:hypothetical protein